MKPPFPMCFTMVKAMVKPPFPVAHPHGGIGFRGDPQQGAFLMAEKIPWDFRAAKGWENMGKPGKNRGKSGEILQNHQLISVELLGRLEAVELLNESKQIMVNLIGWRKPVLETNPHHQFPMNPKFLFRDSGFDVGL